MSHHIRQLSTWLGILTVSGLLAAWAVGVGAQGRTLSDSQRLAEFLKAKGLLSAQDLATLNQRVEATEKQWVTHWSAKGVPPSRTLTSKQLAEFLKEKGLLSAQDLATLNQRIQATEQQWVTHWSATRVPPARTLTGKQLAEFLREKGLLSAQDLATFDRGTHEG